MVGDTPGHLELTSICYADASKRGAAWVDISVNGHVHQSVYAIRNERLNISVEELRVLLYAADARPRHSVRGLHSSI